MADDVKFRLTAEDATRQAFKSVEASLGRIKTEAASVVGGFAAIGGALALGGAAASFQRTVDQMDSLNDAADRTGASVEQLSAVMNTLAPYGATLEQITDATSKLARAMAGADDETKGAGAAFAALGVATRDAAGSLRPTVEVLREVAQALNGYEDGTNKTVLAQSIFGKTGSALLPVLKDLANAKQADATVTTEMAAAAEAFNVNVGVMLRGLDALKVQLVGPVLSALSGIVERFNAAGTSAENFYTRLRLALQPDAEIARLTGNVAKLEAELRGLESVKVLPEFEADRLTEIETITKRLAKARKELNDSSPVQALRQRDDGALRASEDRGFVPGRTQAPSLPAAVDPKAKKAIEDAIEARRKLDELIAQSDVDDTLKQEAAAAKLFADATKDLIEQWSKFEAIDADARLAPNADELAGLQKYADLLREIRGTDSASRSRDSALEAANRQLDSGAITFDEYEKLGSKILGLKDPIAEVAAASKEIFAPIESAFEKALFDGEKLSDLLRSLAVDIGRATLRQQITGPLAESLGKAFGGSGGSTLFSTVAGFFGGARANGGPVSAGKAYLVGERGEELFMPPSSGTIVPNHALGGRSIVVNQTITYGGNDRTGALILAERVKADTIRTMREAQLRGAAV